jgi:hypothetical protein
MRPIQERTALLENYRLCFNLPIGRGERGVANLEPHLGARTWGVLYLITTEQSEHLDRTEGASLGRYRRIPVSLIVDGGEQISGFTYQSVRVNWERKPSQRYISLLIEGAVQHSLPADYIVYLRLTISFTCEGSSWQWTSACPKHSALERKRLCYHRRLASSPLAAHPEEPYTSGS